MTENYLSPFVLLKSLSPFMRVPHSPPNCLPKAPLPNTTTVEIRAAAHGFGGNTNIWPVTHDILGIFKVMVIDI